MTVSPRRRDSGIPIVTLNVTSLAGGRRTRRPGVGSVGLERGGIATASAVTTKSGSCEAPERSEARVTVW
ncbi:MAG: hypothetical protein ACO363_05500 [Balneolaceae bacterium]